MASLDVRLATLEDAEGVAQVCAAGWRETYRDLYPQSYIEEVIAAYYNLKRIRREVSGPPTREWGGYIVAKDDAVIGAIGGGMTSPETGEVFVLYLDPSRRGEGVGTQLLGALTEQQRGFGANEQWVSVEKGNAKGLPFYLARGFKMHEEVQRRSESGHRRSVLRLWRNL